MKKKIIIFLISIAVLFFNFSFIVKAEDGKVEVPETTQGAKEVLMNMIRVGREELPKNMKKLWTEEVLPVWGRMYGWYKDNIWSKVQEGLKKREPAVKEAFGQEKGEMATDIKKEAPKISQYLNSLWQEFKNLFNTDK
ncbi:MAG: hypothetical protein NTZ84_03595 [Candidatus Nealsonbacteria bacterium]|nr:hypothetical protein [Candidatus Nealsonbacteria bacterium]